MRLGSTLAFFAVCAACPSPDAKLAERVEARLQREPDGRQARVTAEDRIVTLTGVVRLGGHVDRARHDEALRIVAASLPEGLRVTDEVSLR